VFSLNECNTQCADHFRIIIYVFKLSPESVHSNVLTLCFMSHSKTYLIVLRF